MGPRTRDREADVHDRKADIKVDVAVAGFSSTWAVTSGRDVDTRLAKRAACKALALSSAPESWSCPSINIRLYRERRHVWRRGYELQM